MGLPRVRSPNPGLPQVLFPGGTGLVGVTCAELAGRPQGRAWPGSGHLVRSPDGRRGDGVKAGSPILRGGGGLRAMKGMRLNSGQDDVGRG